MINASFHPLIRPPVSSTTFLSSSFFRKSVDGEITVTAGQGTGVLMYSNDNGSSYQPGSAFSNLAAGTYDLIVKDANGCLSAMTSVTITAPSQPVITSAVKTTTNGAELSCYNSVDGEITVTAGQGTGVLMYSNDNGSSYQPGSAFSNLAAGTYDLIVKDANGCLSAMTSVTINLPSQPVITSAVKTTTNGAELSCYNSVDGEITVTAG